MVCSPPCKSEPPAPGPWELAGPLSGPPWRKRERLLFGQTSGPAPGLLHETKSGAGNLALHIASYNPRPRLLPSEQGPIFFNYAQETPVTKDTFLVNLQGGCEEFWGHPPLFSLSFLTKCVWAVGVSTNKLESMPPRDSGHCWQPTFRKPRWHLVFECNCFLTQTPTPKLSNQHPHLSPASLQTKQTNSSPKFS